MLSYYATSPDQCGALKHEELSEAETDDPYVTELYEEQHDVDMVTDAIATDLIDEISRMP